MPEVIPVGDGETQADLSRCEVTRAEPPGGDAVDVPAAARRALDSPLGPTLSARVRGDESVAVVVTDVTRATPDDVLLAALLDRLDAAGVARDRVSVVIGLGLHRPLTETEIATALGEHADLAVNHDPTAAVDVGTVDDVPILVHPSVADADLVLSTGMVEPHQYAGFSGGAKTVVIGAGGEPIIDYTHGPDMLAREGVRLGRIESNPFREAIDRAGHVAGPDFCLNVTHGPAGVMGVAAGSPRAVVQELAATAKAALAVDVADGYDAVIAGVGATKAANLYQASRAATYVILGAHNPLRPGGRVVVPARLPEGAGHGTGEQRFYDRLAAATGPDRLYEAMRSGYEPGAQRAFVLARALREHDIWITNSETPAVVEDCLMHAAPSVDGAIEPGSEVLLVPDAMNTLLQ